ncbi:MAG TPA: response regulator [Abditibacteriaceae bacterium]|jgi:DNA-binding response OmpR family regulator
MARVLLVEADPETRNKLVPALEKLNHDVTALEGVAHAWKWEVLDHDFDLYVLGAHPENLFVLGLCSSLHIVYPARPILVLVAGKSPSDGQQAVDAGATAYLPKPVNIVEFERTILELHHEESTDFTA